MGVGTSQGPGQVLEFMSPTGQGDLPSWLSCLCPPQLIEGLLAHAVGWHWEAELSEQAQASGSAPSTG